MDRSDVIGFWDDIADGYSAREQGDIPERIVSDLATDSVISSGSRVLEIGSGPGTYSVPLAKRVSGIECIDSSERMLARLKNTMESQSLYNVTYSLSDWGKYNVPERKFDTVIASLCPFAGSPDSVSHMEACSESWCVLVSWEVNQGDSVSEQIWHMLGYDCDFSGRESNAVIDRLTESGRRPMVERYETVVEYDVPKEQLIRNNLELFRAYGIDGESVRCVIEKLYTGDAVHFNHRNRMRVIRWNPL